METNRAREYIGNLGIGILAGVIVAINISEDFKVGMSGFLVVGSALLIFSPWLLELSEKKGRKIKTQYEMKNG